jgi:hypothetical protein
VPHICIYGFGSFGYHRDEYLSPRAIIRISYSELANTIREELTIGRQRSRRRPHPRTASIPCIDLQYSTYPSSRVQVLNDIATMLGTLGPSPDVDKELTMRICPGVASSTIWHMHVGRHHAARRRGPECEEVEGSEDGCSRRLSWKVGKHPDVERELLSTPHRMQAQ